MGSRSQSRRRANPATISGRSRARSVAGRLGVALRDARKRAGLKQTEVAASVGISQARISNLERGHGHGATIETWACVAAALGEQFVAFLEHAPGATPPRDIEHLRRQSALIELAAVGGWVALPEFAIDPGAIRSRSIDVALVRPATREAIAAEIWDWFDDVGASLRGLDAKVTVLAQRLSEDAGRFEGGGTPELVAAAAGGAVPDAWRVRGLFIVRDTHRNRAIVAELRPLFAARFTGSATAWLRALTSGDAPIPDGSGLLWSDPHVRLTASRLATTKPVPH
jgi:transcriptional regulator with XRE-family HTH domain